MVDQEMSGVAGQQPPAEPSAKKPFDSPEHRQVFPAVERQDDLVAVFVFGQAVPKIVEEMVAIDQKPTDQRRGGRRQPAGPEANEGSQTSRRDQMGQRTRQL